MAKGQHESGKGSYFMTITPAQCRAGRALVEISREKLAQSSQVAVRTVTDFERGAREPIRNTLHALRQALENAGVEFIAENGGGPGVRLKRVSEPTQG